MLNQDAAALPAAAGIVDAAEKCTVDAQQFDAL